MTIIVMMPLTINFSPILIIVPPKTATPDFTACREFLPATRSPITAPAIVPMIIPTGEKKNPAIIPIMLPLIPSLVVPYLLAVHNGIR